MSLRVLVCGDRNFRKYGELFAFLDKFHDKRTITTIIHGDAPGADTGADVWSVVRGVPVERYPAEWNVYGKAAGYIRNKHMIKDGKPEVIIAFAGGKGTENMILEGGKAEKELIMVDR